MPAVPQKSVAVAGKHHLDADALVGQLMMERPAKGEHEGLVPAYTPLRISG
jgi:hypothetical protein